MQWTPAFCVSIIYLLTTHICAAEQAAPYLQDVPTITGKNAYATIHYEGTQRDDEYLLGVRVLIQSLKETRTAADIIILVADSVREPSKEVLAATGAKLIYVPSVPHQIPHNADQTIMKVNLWNQIQYDRIVYLDADVIALNNPDQLFNCGHFCGVFMNRFSFHTGLMVLRPDADEYAQMIQELTETKHPIPNDVAFFASHFRALEFAPLFNLSNTAERCEAKLNRLPTGVNMNHVYFYEHGHWERYRKAPFDRMVVPAYTLAYPDVRVGYWTKPWYWYTYPYWAVNWIWQGYRDQLGDSWTTSFWLHLTAILCFGALCLLLPSYTDPTANARRVTQFVRKWWTKGVEAIGAEKIQAVFAYGLSLLAIYLSMFVVPPMMPPRMALPLFSIVQTVLVYSLLLKCYCFLTGARYELFPVSIMAVASFAMQRVAVYVMGNSRVSPVMLVTQTFVSISLCIFFQARCYLWISKSSVTPALHGPNTKVCPHCHNEVPL